MPRAYGYCLNDVPSAVPVSSGIQVVKLDLLPYQCEINLVFVLFCRYPQRSSSYCKTARSYLLPDIYFSPTMYLLQIAFISLMRKSLAEKTLFILCFEYSSYFFTHSKAYAGSSLARCLLSSFIIHSSKEIPILLLRKRYLFAPRGVPSYSARKILVPRSRFIYHAKECIFAHYMSRGRCSYLIFREVDAHLLYSIITDAYLSFISLAPRSVLPKGKTLYLSICIYAPWC